MKVKKFILILFVLILTISVSGCKRSGLKKLFSKEEPMEIIRSDDEEKIDLTEEGDELRKTVLYFQNSKGLLVPMMRKIPWEEGIANSAINNMIDNPALQENLASTGLSPIIPAGTEIKGITIDENTGLCKIDFTGEVLNYETEKEEENLINGVVYTLTEFPAINEVQVMVDGAVVPTLKHGTEVGEPLKRENINLLGNLENAKSRIVVYFKGMENDEFEYFVPVTIPTIAPMPNVFTALEELFDGPPEDMGLDTAIPDGVNLEGVEVKEGTAYVDVYTGSIDILKEESVLTGMIKNIGITLSQFDEIEKVEILIDGKDLEKVGIDYDYDMAIPVFANEY